MLDTIYHITLKFLKNHIFGVKKSRFGHFYAMLKRGYNVTSNL